MRISRLKRIILVCWLAGVVLLCAWTPHTLGRRDYHLPPVRYAWTWAVPQSGLYSHLDMYRVVLSLAAWTALMGAVFLLAPESAMSYESWLKKQAAIMRKKYPHRKLDKSTPDIKLLDIRKYVLTIPEPDHNPHHTEPVRPTEDVLKCPNCGLIKPPAAERCDCGYDFLNKTPVPPTETKGEAQSHKTAKTLFAVGLVALMLAYVHQVLNLSPKTPYQFVAALLASIVDPRVWGLGLLLYLLHRRFRQQRLRA